MTDQVINHLSRDRFSTYLSASGFDQDKALQLYAWNMRISASFYPLLSSIEVCLRNRVEPRLCQVFNNEWWRNQAFIDLLGKKGKGIVLRAASDIKGRGKSITSGRMTAELSFGFWTNMLLPKYEAALWPTLTCHFPDLPAHCSQADLRRRCEKAKDLRNRISHHEPIFKRNLTSDFGACLELLSWLGPSKAAWIKPQLETMRILRDRPR